jgi:hypothetical protein
VAAAEYTVRINRRDGVLEVIGPEKEWVDAKVEQLSRVFADYAPRPDDGEGDARIISTTSKRATVRRKKTSAVAPTRDDTSETTTPRRQRRTGRAEVNRDLASQLTTELKGRLSAYVAARSKAWKNQSAQAAIIATFLHDELEWVGVDQDDLYTVYSGMGWVIPKNIQSQLTNARQRARYFGGSSDGKLILSHAGENFARHESLGGEGRDS